MEPFLSLSLSLRMCLTFSYFQTKKSEEGEQKKNKFCIFPNARALSLNIKSNGQNHALAAQTAKETHLNTNDGRRREESRFVVPNAQIKVEIRAEKIQQKPIPSRQGRGRRKSKSVDFPFFDVEEGVVVAVVLSAQKRQLRRRRRRR